MAQHIKLNTSTSVVDYLKSVNKPADFTSRGQMFKEGGLEERLGKFVGSANQNVALLKHAQSQNKPIAPTPIAPETITPAQDLKPLTGPTTTPSGAVVDAVTGQLITPPPGQPEAPIKPITATEALSNLGFQPSTLTAEQAVIQATGAPLFDVFKEKKQLAGTLATAQAEAKKQQLETESATKTKELIDTLGRRGLFFSGQTETGIKSLVDSLAMSKLGVDRELAGKLLESDLDVRERILKDVEKIVSDAQSDDEKKSKRALDILENQGLTIGPDGKTLVPTLAAERAEEANQINQAKFEFQQQQREITNQINQAKLELQMAKDIQSANNATERLNMAQERLNLAQERFQLQVDKVKSKDTFTETQSNKGAANANMPIEEFKRLDADTKNYFINNKTLINKAKKDIDEEISKKVNAQSLKDGISKQQIPQKVKDLLNSYIDIKAPKKDGERNLWHPSTWF